MTHKRAQPGTKGGGEFYRIVVRPKGQFTSFRNHDVGDAKGLERVAGHRSSGSWATQAWLVSKDMAHVENGILIGDHPDAIKLIKSLQTQPVQKKMDVFEARDRRNVPEREKPTQAQLKAWSENIKKAQAARHK